MSDFTPNLSYYRPSGSASLVGVIATLFLGLLVGIPLACLYAFVNHHDPLLYLNILLAGGFGIALGWVVGKGIHRFQIRNIVVALLIAFPIFVAAYLTHWVAYIATVVVDWETDSPYNAAMIFNFAREIMKSPSDIWAIICELNETGIWSISSSSSSNNTAVKGIVLSLIWFVEAVVILWYTLKQPFQEAGKPYSERSEKWITPETLPLPIAFIEDKQALLSALARNDYSMLTTPLPPTGEDDMSSEGQHGHAQVVLYRDPFEPCVSIQNVSIKIKKKKKKMDAARTEIIRYLKITPSVAENIWKALGGLSV